MTTRRDLLLACTAVAVGFASMLMTQPLVPLFASELGASELGVGGLAAAQSLLPLLAAIPAGVWIDRLGARRVIVAGAALLSLGPALVAAGSSLTALVAGQTVSGLAQLVFVLGIQTYVAGLGEGRAREASFSWFTTFQSAGHLAGPILGGAWADVLGYRAAFGLAAGVALVGLPLALRLTPRGEGGLPSGAVWQGSEVRRLLGDGGIRLAMASSFAVLFVMGARRTFLPLYLRELGYTATAIGSLLSVRALASMLVRPFFSRFIQVAGGRFGALVLAMAASAAGVGMIPLLRGYGPLLAVSVLAGVGVGISQPLSLVIVADQTPEGQRGLALGTRITGNRLAQFVNPVLFGVLAQWGGLPVAFYTGGLLLAFTSALLFRWRGAVAKEREAVVAGR